MLLVLGNRVALTQPLRHACRRWITTKTSPSPEAQFGGTMSAWQIDRYGRSEVLNLNSSVSIPTLRNPNDVLIEVHAASVNPIDVKMRGGYGRVMHNVMRNGLSALPFLQPEVPSEFPIVLGRDFSGVVMATGQNVKNFKPGDEVWGACSINRPGSHAEFIIASKREISRKPINLTHVEAGSMPYVAMTTWCALSTVGEITEKNAENKRVLILAGSGGVGNFAIQLMKSWSAEVTTTCSTDAIERCESLGADNVVDYTVSDVNTELAKIHGFDLILDTIGTSSPAVSFDLLKTFRNSKYVTIVPPLLRNADDNGFVVGAAKSVGTLGCKVIEGLRGGRSYRWALFVPNGKALGVVRELVESGKIIPVVEKVFPFDEVPAAFDKVEAPHARGKTVIDLK